MAGLAQSIGSYSFLSLEGEPGVRCQVIELMQLPYTNGESQRKMGLHSEPFTLQSCVDLASTTDALNKLDDYADLAGAAAQTLIWRGVTFENLTDGTKVSVIAVRPNRIVSYRSIVGGLNVSDGASGVMLYADWTVRLVPE